MALDIMQTLVEILCPTHASASACNTFINTQSHQVVQPLGPLIYFLFFPVVFLILLIYIGTGVVLRGNVVTVRGLRLLLAIAVLVAIVIQGSYPIMLWLSDLWFLVLPFIFIIYFIVRHRGGPGRGGGAAHGIGGGIIHQLVQRGKDEFTGERGRLEDMVDLSLKELERVMKESKHDQGAWRAYEAALVRAHETIGKYESMVKIGGRPVGGDCEKKFEKLKQLVGKGERMAA